MKRLFKSVIISLLAMSFVACSNSSKLAKPNDKDIRIIFTNDIHCGFRENLGMPKLMKYYSDINDYKLLVDAGDFSQGDSLGTINNGTLTYELMDGIGYDFVVPGNHEFDRKVPSFLNSSMILNSKMYCCNFYDVEKNQLVFDPYKIFKLGNKNVALIGAISPDTIRTTSYRYFQDKDGKYVYSFMNEDGLDGFSANIQKYVNETRENGADYVVLVMHHGDILSSIDYTSADIISHLSGIDAVIDGHSHNKYNILVKDKDGKEVHLTQTGTKLESVGDLTIDKEGKISVKLIESVDGTSVEAENALDDIYKKLDEYLGDVLKENITFDLTTSDIATGKRAIRNAETNLGDFCADAIRDAGKSDVAIINGGGIRADIKSGNIVLKNIYEVFPFSNNLSTVLVSGKVLKDIIEFGTCVYPVEYGTFFQVSGITFTLDATKETNVVYDEEGTFQYVNGEYRVKDILVNGEPLDDNKEYTLTTISYFTENYGSGCKMFEGLKSIADNICFDADALADYAKKADMEKYKNPYGDGRINIIVE